MKSIPCLLVMLLCLVLAGSACADQQKVYFNLGLAWAEASYPTEIQNVLDNLADQPNVDHVQVGIDLTLYFALRPGSVLGVSMNGIGDRFEADSDHMQINQYLFAASFRHYPSRSVGRGLFVRGDVGIARMVVDVSGADDATSDTGMGFLVGGGYSWKIGGGTWFSINADYTTKTIEDETVGGVTVGGAFLF